ncbi:MAG TPA: C39 family peptidase, partial [Clostridiales bacterium]|nr:C39 family peptidase [Clostridiales bacterium]
NAFSDILSNPEYIMPESYEINVNCVYQNPELPTGCEVTSLTTVLNYFGYKIGKTDMANNYLIKDKYGATDFSTAFIGNPQTTRGYGCYSPVIVNTAQRFLNDYGNIHSVVDLSGYELSELFKVVSSDYPLVIWCTMSLVEPKEVYVWSLAGNIDVYWMQNEHCVVLTGYDLVEGTVTVSDPLKGIVKYNLQAFENRYNQLGKQVVAIK